MSGLRMAGRLRSLAGALAAGAFMVAGLSGTAAYATEEAPRAAAPQLGIQFNADGDAGQCGGRTGEQWTASPDWTQAIRFDTDSRAGGCQLAFGVYDPDRTLAGASVSYSLRPSSGGDAGQCGNYQGTYAMPILPIQVFGQAVRLDTDGRPGWCDLTFTVTGNIVLDVQFYPDGDAGQCPDALPAGQYRSGFVGTPVTVKIDADGRAGGCQFQLRLRHF
ncbi:hypothetical protein [Streptomyces sp. SP18BB07]|uniref:hypothetical protein n=1 Tax=Streptomyces sp. SP18BB07 TaxID=3002522 RepID=UPI002E78FF6C|nr:hypothetical protein [Streptomyces sp. SP18BB07]MEE1762186.1 hypothetical protein [Streptomyces sp. SP18BB07]